MIHGYAMIPQIQPEYPTPAYASAHMLHVHKHCRQLSKPEATHKIISGQAGDVLASLEFRNQQCQDLQQLTCCVRTNAVAS